jgi:thioredoxin
MTTPIAATDQEFAETVLKADGLVMVEFWATWCASCRMLAPILDELAADYASRVSVVKVNVDENPDYATEYQVGRTPTIVFFRDGVEVERIVGAGKKADYTEKLEALLG